jgi:hypothetical protein
MTSLLIYVFSIAALIQFFFHYCRSALASSRSVELSPNVREAAGVDRKEVSAEDFQRFVQLVRLCPGNGGPSRMRAVGGYYGFMDVLGRVSRSLVPGLAAWTENERRQCSHFAAVALDRRISSSREFFLEGSGQL